MIDLDFSFTADLWIWRSSGSDKGGSWHFVTLPQDISKDIKAFTRHRKTGFGSVRVKVTCEETEWLTSIFPSKEQEAYILPIKKSVRTSENLMAGKTGTFKISVLM